MKRLLTFLVGMAALSPAVAQRQTDALDRGLVAVRTGNNIFCSWRLQADEYYDVTYNIYRDGVKLNDAPLTTSNYLDKGGSLASSYAVEPVVRGVAQAKSAAVTPWEKNYLEIQMDHGSLTSNYIPNDACCADVDGDGELEILLKFDNANDDGSAAGHNGEYEIIEVYKLNGKKLWWIDCGPNIGDFQNNELNIVAFDWDQDGKAEAVLRLADAAVIHKADGTTTTIGNASVNVRPSGAQSGQWFIHEGAEYLVYLNGETGEVYDQQTYPLKRLENGETDLAAAWGDGYGHRSTKHFFGAPFLDGKKPSIFMARGIYTRHKMIAMDVDAASHKLTTRWTWNCATSGSSWYGQGYHNYGIADVDMDGRDEICYGSMVIDDNGKGLSTSGLGHGDSQHHGDFDPYTWGLEIFACNESQPQNNFRDATTSKIYYRSTGGSDDGRAIAGNFYDEYPGAQAISARDANVIGGASHKAITGASKNNIAQNFRIYWDGDLLDETFNYVSGKNTAGGIYKAGSGLIATLEGSMTNNDTKGTPCYQGDLFGDWREEVIMRTEAGNIRIYTTNIETPYRNYSLWYDHQYRNAMVWQMCGYNQTPHVSYFLGKLEGITMAPPPLTLAGRTELTGATIGTEHNDKHILLDTQADATIAVADGASPYIFTDNAPSWTQGHDNNNNITTTKYTHTLTGGAFTGAMRLVKQGEGTLVLPSVVQTYTGETSIWNGTLQFDGTLQGSRLWLNRHTSLVTDGGKFPKGIQADYNATIQIGGDEAAGTLEADSLILGFGSRVKLDVFAATQSADQIKVKTLKVETKDWKNGPEYLAPVFQLVRHYADGEEQLTPGKYCLGEVDALDGSLSDIVIEGMGAQGVTLTLEDGKLYAEIGGVSEANITWKGVKDSDDGYIWDLNTTANFVNDETGQATVFVSGSSVTFDDNTDVVGVQVVGNLAPRSLRYNNSAKNLTLRGDSLIGGFTLTKDGTMTLSVNDANHIGKTIINAGTVVAKTLANSTGQDYGSLGGVNDSIIINNNATLRVGTTQTTTQPIKLGTDSATIEMASGYTLTLGKGLLSANRQKAVLTKAGVGSLTLGTGNSIAKLVIARGNVNAQEASNVTALPTTVEFVNGVLYDPNTEGSYSTNNANFVVPALCAGTVHSDPRCNYKGSLTGEGTFTFYAGGARTYLQGDWSKFEGTLVPATEKRGTYGGWFAFDNNYGLGKATLKMNSGVEFDNNGHNVEIGTLTGTGTLRGSGSYILGANGNDFTLETNCSSNVIKRGEGVMNIGSVGLLTGSLTVEAGVLTNSDFLFEERLNGTGSVTLKGTSKMMGQTYVNTLLLNGTAQVDLRDYYDPTIPVQVETASGLTASGNSTVNFLITGDANSTLVVGGNLSLAYATVTLSADYTPKDGDAFTLWTAKKLSTFDVDKLTLPTLPTGLYWDTAGLNANTGILRVVNDASAISSVAADVAADYEVYTVGGAHVGNVHSNRQGFKKAVARLGVQQGTYIIRCKDGSNRTVGKVVLR